MEKWRFLNSGKCSAGKNMAIDETIMSGVQKGVSPPTIRVYDWQPPTISLGYHQQIEQEIDIEKTRQMGFAIIRRPTGGRTVLHYDELTYAVIGKIEGILSGSTLQAYQTISKALIRGLSYAGIDLSLEKKALPLHKHHEKKNPCFSSSAKYELIYKPCSENSKWKKVVGSAQFRKNGVLLQHGSILLNHNQELMAGLMYGLSNNERELLKKFLAQNTISINQILTRKISFSLLAEKIFQGFKQEWDIELTKADDLNNEERKIYPQIFYKYKNKE